MAMSASTTTSPLTSTPEKTSSPSASTTRNNPPPAGIPAQASTATSVSSQPTPSTSPHGEPSSPRQMFQPNLPPFMCASQSQMTPIILRPSSSLLNSSAPQAHMSPCNQPFAPNPLPFPLTNRLTLKLRTRFRAPTVGISNMVLSTPSTPDCSKTTNPSTTSKFSSAFENSTSIPTMASSSMASTTKSTASPSTMTQAPSAPPFPLPHGNAASLPSVLSASTPSAPPTTHLPPSSSISPTAWASSSWTRCSTAGPS